MNNWHAHNLCCYFQMQTGVRRITANGGPEPWWRTHAEPDDAELLARIDALRSASFVQIDERGRELLAFGDALRDRLNRGCDDGICFKTFWMNSNTRKQTRRLRGATPSRSAGPHRSTRGSAKSPRVLLRLRLTRQRHPRSTGASPR